MVPSGFILMPSLLLRNISPLFTSVQLSILTRDIFQSPCPHMSMLVVAYLEFIMVLWLVVSSKRAPERWKGCESPTANNLGSLVIIENYMFSTPSRLVILLVHHQLLRGIFTQHSRQ